MIQELEFPVRAAGLVDVSGILPAHIKRNRPPRADDRFAHFSDIGACDRQIYARRAGHYDNSAPDRLLFCFEVGHFGEAQMLAALRERFEPEGWTITPGGLVLAFVHDEGISFEITDDDDTDSLDPADTVIGHPDFLMTHPENGSLLLDAKTTSFPVVGGKREPPGNTRVQNILQAAGYGVALDTTQFGIWSACKSGGGDELLTYTTRDYAPLILRRLRELVRVTHPAAPEPPPQPPAYTCRVLSRGPRKGLEISSACEWCSNSSCPRNENIGDFAE